MIESCEQNTNKIKLDKGIYFSFLAIKWHNDELQYHLDHFALPPYSEFTPTYLLLYDKPKLFSLGIDTKEYTKILMSDVVGAISAAPTYFEPKKFNDSFGANYIEADSKIMPIILKTFDLLKRLQSAHSLSERIFDIVDRLRQYRS